jgi:receptor protein-tyrosine kinase
MSSTIERAALRLQAQRQTRQPAIPVPSNDTAVAVDDTDDTVVTFYLPSSVSAVARATPSAVAPVDVVEAAADTAPTDVGSLVPTAWRSPPAPPRPPWWSGERAAVPPWVSPVPVRAPVPDLDATRIAPAADRVEAAAPRAEPAGVAAPADYARPAAYTPDEVLAEPTPTAVETDDSRVHDVMLRGERSARRSLDLPRMAAEGLLVPGAPLHAAADEFRSVKRGLLRAIAAAAQQGARRPNLVLVTSAGPREGKTWCALNLALGLAGEVDHSALVVDLAGGPQGLAARVGLPPTLGGVLDLLAQPGRLAVSDVMAATQIPKFSVLPLGAKTPHAAELLGSYAMDALLDDLARRYRDRVVILDAPGVLESSEVVPLASQVGQVLMVVAQETAPTESVRKAFGMLADCPRVMSVFNRSASLAALHGRVRPGGVRG